MEVDAKLELDLQLDPNSNKAKEIEKKIDALVPKYQDAYSDVVGTRVSLGVANTSLKGRKVPTLGGTTPTEKAGVPPVKEEVKPTPSVKDKTKVTDTGIKDATKDAVISDKVTDKGKKDKVKIKTAAELRAEALDVGRESDFTLPETIFNNVDSLKTLIAKYSDPKSKMTEKQFRKELRDDVWFRKNSLEIKNRYIQLYNYEDLVKTGQIDPQVKGNTEYEKQIATLERQVADKARAMGSAAASDPDAIKKAARNMYITNVGIDDPMVTDFLAASIRPIGSTIAGAPTQGYSGDALKNYQTLQATAKANGFKVSDIIPGGSNERQVLEGIAKGAIDVNRVAQDARKLAAQGQPDYVRDLLGQGYNLEQVYAPYRQTMASILEIQDPNEIDLNDSTLRSAITDKGDMNLYDFKKTLKKDDRWQYTENARKEVSDITLKVLRDFGFQG